MSVVSREKRNPINGIETAFDCEKRKVMNVLTIAAEWTFHVLQRDRKSLYTNVNCVLKVTAFMRRR